MKNMIKYYVMARQTRHRNKKRRVKGGGSKTLKNQKITFTLFVGDDGVYLQPPTVSPSIIQSNLKKGKLDIKDLPGSINSNIREALQDYDMNTFDLTPVSSDPVISDAVSSDRPMLNSLIAKSKDALAKSKDALAKSKDLASSLTSKVTGLMGTSNSDTLNIEERTQPVIPTNNEILLNSGEQEIEGTAEVNHNGDANNNDNNGDANNNDNNDNNDNNGDANNNDNKPAPTLQESENTRITDINAMKTRFLAAIEKNYNELKPK